MAPPGLGDESYRPGDQRSVTRVTASASHIPEATAPAAKYRHGSQGATPASPSESAAYSAAPSSTSAISATGPRTAAPAASANAPGDGSHHAQTAAAIAAVSTTETVSGWPRSTAVSA